VAPSTASAKKLQKEDIFETSMQKPITSDFLYSYCSYLQKFIL